MTPEEERQLDAEADAYQAEADEARKHEGCRMESDALRARVAELEGMDPYERIRDYAQTLIAPRTANVQEQAQLIAANLNRASKILPTASWFVSLDVLAGELGRFADEVREETHDEGEPR